jgi:2-amino-4-hydroxy-6-hydroxymethyldihydropteridine diphosphokinase
MQTVYLGIGSNLGDRIAHCNSAIDCLSEISSIRVLGQSEWFLSEPFGHSAQPWFVNGVVKIGTFLEPLALLDVCLMIETQAQRVRSIPWGPRSLDIDILLWKGRVKISKRLMMPHPWMHLRRFVLLPLCAIDPELRHPLTGLSMRSHLDNLPDSLIVKPLSITQGDFEQ